MEEDDLRSKIADIIQDAGENGCERWPAEDAADKILKLLEDAMRYGENSGALEASRRD